MKRHKLVDKYDILLVAIIGVSIFFTYYSITKTDALWRTVEIISESVLTGTILAIVSKKIIEKSFRR